MTSRLGIHAVTWNVHGEQPSSRDGLNHLLGLPATEYFMDIIAVGLQEVPLSPSAWLPRPLAESPWTAALCDCLAPHLFILLETVQLHGTLLHVFVQRAHIPFISDVETCFNRTFGWYGFKGSVSVRFKLYHVTVAIVNSHFTPHGVYMHDRLLDYSEAVSTHKYPKSGSSLLEHDYVFWVGDFNFRLDKDSHEQVVEAISAGDLPALWPHDQLTRCRCEQLCFQAFEEAPLAFPPTYKFSPGSERYEKERVPSWTDRVLWSVTEDSFRAVKLAVQPLSYTSLRRPITSDHRAVVAQLNFVVVTQPAMPLVQFLAIEQPLYPEDDLLVRFTSLPLPSSSDSVLMVTQHPRSSSDYLFYRYVTPTPDLDDVFSVVFPPSWVNTLPPGIYCCIYVSAAGAMVAISDNFILGDVAVSECDTESSEEVVLVARGDCPAPQDEAEEWSDGDYDNMSGDSDESAENSPPTGPVIRPVRPQSARPVTARGRRNPLEERPAEPEPLTEVAEYCDEVEEVCSSDGDDLWQNDDGDDEVNDDDDEDIPVEVI